MAFWTVSLQLIVVPAPVNLVLHIVSMCTQQQVVRVTATSHVARMAHYHPLRDLFASGAERKRVRPYLTIPVPKHAITVVLHGGGPQPTIVRATNLNFGPEPLLWRSSVHAVLLRAEQFALLCGLLCPLQTYALSAVRVATSIGLRGELRPGVPLVAMSDEVSGHRLIVHLGDLFPEQVS